MYVCCYSSTCQVASKGAWVAHAALMNIVSSPGAPVATVIGSVTTNIREYQVQWIINATNYPLMHHISSHLISHTLPSGPFFSPTTDSQSTRFAVGTPVCEGRAMPQCGFFLQHLALLLIPLTPGARSNHSQHVAVKDGASGALPSTIPESLQATLLSSLNESQVRAVGTICRGGTATNVHLLQGPPGTGKTKTVLSILSAILAGGLGKRDSGPAKVCDLLQPHGGGWRVWV